jgi:hypothetical protein
MRSVVTLDLECRDAACRGAVEVATSRRLLPTALHTSVLYYSTYPTMPNVFNCISRQSYAHGLPGLALWTALTLITAAHVAAEERYLKASYLSFRIFKRRNFSFHRGSVNKVISCESAGGALGARP